MRHGGARAHRQRVYHASQARRILSARGKPAGAPLFMGEFSAPQVEPQPEPEAAIPVVSLFGKKIQLYDPTFPPTRWVMGMIQRLRR